ncbi:MAG: LptA/OstA family protein [Brevinemataceae bacterium]
MISFLKKYIFSAYFVGIAIQVFFFGVMNSQQVSPPVAITSGKAYLRVKEKFIYLETANKRRPTLSQGPALFVSDIMIYDEEKEIGYAYGNLRFADIEQRSFFSAQEGTYFAKEKKIVLHKTPEILLEQSSNVSTKINGKIITIYPDDSYIHVQGNIEIDDGTTFITGKEARIWSKQNKMSISGDVQSISDTQKLAADSLTVLFEDGDLASYTAQGNVKAVSTVDKFTLCSSLLNYNNKEQYFQATESPLIFFHEQDTIAYGNTIEYYRETKMGSLLGNVVAIQKDESQKAFSQWAIYNGSNNTLTMYGSPKLKQNDSELFANEIIVNIDSNNMELVGGGRGFFNRQN